MAKVTTSSAYDIEIISVLITSDRFPTEFEIVQNVTEINIFENLDNAHLTGNLIIADSSDIMGKVKFLGTERIQISLKIKGDDRSKVRFKNFVVENIASTAPINDTAEGLLLNIIEEHAYLSRLMTVSKAYSGKPENIIAQIMSDNLKIFVDVPNSFSGSAVAPMKVITPAITPLKAARWIRNRMTTEFGSPFYLYSTFNGPNIFLTDLDHMLTQRPVNEGRPYMYGQAFASDTVSRQIDQQARTIENYSLNNSEHMLRMATDGILNSNHKYVDTVETMNDNDSTVEIRMQDILDSLKDRGVISREQSSPIYDSKFTINDKKLDEYLNNGTIQLTSSNTHSSWANYYESEDIQQQKMKAYSMALRHYLMKSPINIVMPGFDFMGRGDDISIGRQISMNFLKNDPGVKLKGESALDPKRSGDYLIYALRHHIKPERYSVSMSCVKLGDKNG